MSVLKLLTVTCVSLAVAQPALSHPGPEPHPTMGDLEEVASELRSTVDNLDQRLNTRINEIESIANALDEAVMADAIREQVNKPFADLGQTSAELQDRVEAMAALGVIFIIGLTGVTAFLGFRIRALRKLHSGSLHQPSNFDNGKKNPANDSQPQVEEDENPKSERRVVTHTLKDGSRTGTGGRIMELHNPEASWSPRTIDEAIDDIRTKGVSYWARGPQGNESEIEVKEKSGTAYLRTEPDEHRGNNLGELPNP